MSKKTKKVNDIDFGGAFEVINDNIVYYDTVTNGFYRKLCSNRIYLTKVTYSGPATVAFWSDGTKTVTKCSPADVYNKETGLAICMLKKMIGAKSVMTTFKNWVPDTVDDKTVSITTKDIRDRIKATL